MKKTKLVSKTAIATSTAIDKYDKLADAVAQTVFRDYYSDVLAACIAKASAEIAARGLNPAMMVTTIEHYVPVILWALIPGVNVYHNMSDEPVITKVCAWVDMPRPYFDQDNALHETIRRGRGQIRDAFMFAEVPPTYPVVRSWVERAPCLKLLLPSLTFQPRKLTPTVIPMPDLNDAISILTMYQTMYMKKEIK